MKIATCEAVAEIFEVPTSDFKHPYLTYARFVLADDKPNSNAEGIEHEDFEALKQSAIDMPIKIKFLSSSAGGHKGSIPIGHIRSVTETSENGNHQLIAEAVLYANEYPEEVAFLKEAYASGNAPGISWEVGYKESIKKNGVSWLKGVIAKAATFVKNPAYGTRTALLALASADITQEELYEGLTSLASETSNLFQIKGGNNMDEKREKELMDQLDALKKELSDINSAKGKVEDELKTTRAEVASKDEIIAEYAKNTLIETRTKKVQETGLKIEADAEKLKAKQEFWASLTEDAFAEYVEDLAAASKAAPAAPAKSAIASAKTDIPKITTPSDLTDFDSLKSRLRGYGPRAVATTE